MLYIFATLMAILFYLLLLVPVAGLVVLLHVYLLKRVNSKTIKRAVLFGLLILLVTPLQLDSGSGAFIDLTVPRPLYTFYLDMMYTGGIGILLDTVRLNPVFSIAGVLASMLGCAYLARKAYQ